MAVCSRSEDGLRCRQGVKPTLKLYGDAFLSYASQISLLARINLTAQFLAQKRTMTGEGKFSNIGGMYLSATVVLTY